MYQAIYNAKLATKGIPAEASCLAIAPCPVLAWPSISAFAFYNIRRLPFLDAMINAAEPSTDVADGIHSGTGIKLAPSSDVPKVLIYRKVGAYIRARYGCYVIATN